MRAGYVQLLLIFVLVCLLATPRIIRRLTVHPATVPTTDAGQRYGFSLTEVSKKAGIDFVHTAPQLDAKLDAIMPQIASSGAAVSVVDFDRDGWPDLYVINSGEGSKNRLYRNQHDGTFKDIAEQMGIADLNQPGTGVCTGAVWADYDNDGYEDLLVYKWGKPELFHNDRGQGFIRATDRAGLPKWVNANSAIWFDYDHDGKVDLFIAGYWRDDIDLWHLTTTKIMPESFEYAHNGGRKYLLHNNGDGTFTDVTEQMGIDSHRWTLAAVAADFRGTGYEDLFLANDYGVAELYANEKGEHFREIGEASGVGKGPKSGMSVSIGDVLNRGLLSIYKTNISEEGVLIQGNDLWVRDHAERPGLTYANLAGPMSVELGGWSWGAQFGDFNNDGWIDLFCTNGYISADRNQSYWYDFAKVAGGHNSIISDAANWPPMRGRSLSGYQQKKLWLNQAGAGFIEVSQAVGATDTYDGRAVAVADLWNRGALDVVISNQKGPALVYRNEVGITNHWVEFELEGTRSNRSAIGALVYLYWNGQQQLQCVTAGSGFAAENDRRVHFGLGKTTAIDKVVIRWPSGLSQTITSPGVDAIHHVTEPVSGSVTGRLTGPVIGPVQP